MQLVAVSLDHLLEMEQDFLDEVATDLADLVNSPQSAPNPP